jgi:DNA (cytosine-5)-methyltransferase 1
LLKNLKENIMNHGSLFSGIGGFDLAAEWMGWSNKFHCDINPFSRKLCNFYWPEAQSYDNIKTTDFTIWRGKIDVLSGGFPCQPFSNAGKRMGKEDERHLWPEFHRAIREIRPRYVVGENVRGLLSWSNGLVLEEVYADLEGEGYEVQTFVLPAVGINAPHRRDRVYIVAKDTSSDGCVQRESEQEGTSIREFGNTSSRGGNGVHIQKGDDTNTNSWGLEGSIEIGRNSKYVERKSDIRFTANTEQLRLEHGSEAWDVFGSVSETQGKERKSPDESKTDDNVYTEQGGPSETWDCFPIKSPLCSGDDGLPHELDGLTFPKWRKESIMGYGNAIVPQIAYRIFATIDESENR